MQVPARCAACTVMSRGMADFLGHEQGSLEVGHDLIGTTHLQLRIPQATGATAYRPLG